MATAASVGDVSSAEQRANGFALIISNDYTGAHGAVEKLGGTLIDATLMKSTFEQLKFAVLHKHNVNRLELMELLRQTACCKYPPSYRRIVIVFSGHGTDNYQLYDQDGKLVKVKDMLEMFFPEREPLQGGLPKLFFIDACRGDTHCRAVLVPKGGNEKTALPVPQHGNLLVAYSTIPGHQSYEEKGAGGVWMSLLAQRLLSDDTSVLDILTKVNTELLEKYKQDPRWMGFTQQPECLSRLNEKVFLLREARNRESPQHYATGGAEIARLGMYSLPACLNSPAVWPTSGEYVSSRNKIVPPTNFSTPPSPSGSSCSSSGGSPYNTTPPQRSHYPRRSDSSPPQVQIAMSRGTSPRRRLEQYCIEKDKPKPTFQCRPEHGQFVARVYVAKTCGWVDGNPKPEKAMAEMDAATELLKKLHFH